MIIQPYKSGNLILSVERLGAHFRLLSGMPGRYKWQDRQLVFQPIGVNINYLLEHFPDAEWKDGAEMFRDEYISLKQQEQNTREEKKELLMDDSGYEYKTVPYQHQRQAFLLSRDREVFALFHEQGCGKTKVIIDSAAYLFEKGNIEKLIVVAKNGVHINWVINEFPAHMPERIQMTRTWYSANRKNKTIIQPRKSRGKLNSITFNIEGFSSKFAEELLIGWMESGTSMLVVDESSFIKNPQALRTKFLIKVGEMAQCHYRRIMTGTPITRGIENLYSQFRFLDQNILGHKSFYTFRAEYCIMGGFEGKAIIGYKKQEELIKIVDGHSHRVLKAECLDLPKKIYKRIPFEMSTTQRKLYDAYRKGAIEELEQLLKGHRDEDYFLEKAKELAITKALRLQQITCGLMPDASGERIPGAGNNPRMDALMSYIEEFDGKMIVWAKFKQDLLDITKALGDKAVPYFGGISEKERIASLQRFQNSDKVWYFVASQQAAAYGLTLTAAKGSTYHTNASSLDLRLQSEDRNHRIGTVERPIYTDIEAVRSIDQKIINTLRKHKELADIILQDPVSLFMEEEPEDGSQGE